MKKSFGLILALVVVAAFAAFIFFKGNQTPQFKTLTIGTVQIRVEVADTNAKRTQGLSDRPSLAPDAGMLFTFDKSGNYGFWMKGMNFPLDFIYLNNSKVVEVKENVPASDLTPFYPAEPVLAVVEVNAGFVKQNNVAVGQVAAY